MTYEEKLRHGLTEYADDWTKAVEYRYQEETDGEGCSTYEVAYYFLTSNSGLYLTH